MVGRPERARAHADLVTADALVIAKWDRADTLDVGRLADHQGRDRRRGSNQGTRPRLYRHRNPHGAQAENSLRIKWRKRLAKGEPKRNLAKSYGVSVSMISRLS